ncbi:MAG: YdiU family protein [Micropepsaceae bacterium]
MRLGFDHAYKALPERFYAPVTPARVADPKLIAFNDGLARELGLDVEAVKAEAAELFSGNAVPEDAQPIALAYAGHQFGNFVPQLGDGRAVLLGEIVSGGVRRDVQLKGSGQTPFSRRGDGRAALGPVLREYIVSEAMHALGVPTTRALAAVATGMSVLREAGMLPGAVLTRVAASHIRVGTFQYFAARRDVEALRLLADHVIQRHYPGIAGEARPYLKLFEAVLRRQAKLVAQWMVLGFIHGVMNTDNCAVSGETIDYGPCAFLDAYDPAKKFSAIDEGGRYAFGNQPGIAQWNMARFAETLLGLIDEDIEAAIAAANDVLTIFPEAFREAWTAGMRAKLGLGAAPDEDETLIGDLLNLMAAAGADFTLTFQTLTRAPHTISTLLGEGGEAWLARWTAREPDVAAMERANPVRIPRNHRIEQVIQAAEGGDFAPFHRMNAALAQPYESDPAFRDFEAPPEAGEEVARTFCGT